MNMKRHPRNCPLLPSVYGYDDACALARAYSRGEADPVAITETCLEAGRRSKGVYIAITEDRALAEAEAARTRYRAKIPLSPLDGVPIGWKDLFAVKGSVTTAGSAVHKNDPPSASSSHLAVLSARAGLVCAGKLNTAEFAYSSVGINPHFGTPVNPHSPEDSPRMPGGSSCGSGVAVAAGLLPIAIGTDTGGSVRIPAAINGVAGFRPTVGRYSREGQYILSPTLDTAGPLARSVRDLVAMDRILRGTLDQDIPEPAGIKGRRFVLDDGLLDDDVISPAVRRMTEAACKRLETAGAHIARKAVTSLREALRIISGPWIMGYECFASIREILDDPDKAGRIDQRIRKRAEGARNADAYYAIQSIWARQKLAQAAVEELGGAILIVPTVGFGAPPLRELLESDEVFFKLIAANIRFTAPQSLLDLPGVALPAGVDEQGMPLGITLYGARGTDEAVLETALAAECALVHA